MSSETNEVSFYKVVIEDDFGRLESASRPLRRDLRVRYAKGVESFPSIPGSKLFVFSDLREAKFFYQLFTDICKPQLWKCEVVNPVVAPPLVGASYAIEYWKEYANGLKFDEGGQLNNSTYAYKSSIQYPSTHFCDSLKLSERLF